MKRFFIAFLSIVCSVFFFVSCSTKLEVEILGCWVPTDNPNISFYLEFSNDKINYYELQAPEGTSYEDKQYCTFDNGTLYVPQSYTWDIKMRGDYTIEDNLVFYSGFRMGTLTRVDKDTYQFDAALMVGGTYRRVKRFKTK